ncbi:cytochrome P450 [Actinomadura sp. NEAU-AAG7]|uniref:cytochrome P450 n=1 Tax=Actinomadura sp. NEAU-AAG7 TaxID=2839640 RepID=UPI001BE4A4B2|nr:cytochrome P450 [Actinomadura sp. NEAU-AAG7]MBT2207721.1 cytochrome P450 [Actinomadura sp. NEAU-AAG7]
MSRKQQAPADRFPAPPRIRLRSTVLPMVRDPLGFMASLPAHGDLVRIGAGPLRAYVACSPQIARSMLANDRDFDKGGPVYDQARVFLGNGLASCGHADHRIKRRQMQPAFHRARMPGYAQIMSERIDALTGTDWHHGQTIDPREEFYSIVVATTAAALFGTDPDAADISRSYRATQETLTAGFRRMADPTGLTARLPTRANRRYQQAVAEWSALVHQTARQARRDGPDRGTLLSALAHSRNQDGTAALTDAELHDQIKTLMVAGYESTSSALAWACHLLAAHPDIQEHLHAEARSVLDGRPADFSDLPRLELTRQVLLEALRLYPVGWLFTRRTTRDTELGGYRLPQGTTTVFCTYLLHRLADWFPEPAVFDPGRWAGPGHPERSPAFMPFGSGARQCIGNDFALTLAPLLLATLADRWHLTIPPGAPRARPLPHLTLVPSPAPLTLHRR